MKRKAKVLFVVKDQQQSALHDEMLYGDFSPKPHYLFRSKRANKFQTRWLLSLLFGKKIS